MAGLDAEAAADAAAVDEAAVDAAAVDETAADEAAADDTAAAEDAAADDAGVDDAVAAADPQPLTSDAVITVTHSIPVSFFILSFIKISSFVL